MKLTKKQIKKIQSLGGDHSPEKIAAKLRLARKDVESILRSSEEGPGSIRGSVASHDFVAAIRQWGLVGLILLAPCIFWRGIYDFANLPQYAFIQTGSLTLLLVWIASGLGGSLRVRLSPLLYPLLAFLAWSFFSLAWAHNRYEGIITWLNWANGVLIFFLVLQGPSVEKTARSLLVGLAAVGLLVTLLGLSQYFFGFAFVPQAVSPAATFANKNMVVHFLVLVMPLVCGFFLESTKRYAIWGLMITGALMATFLFYTRTRAGWVALAVECLALAAFLLWERHRRNIGFFWNHEKNLALAGCLLITLVAVNLGPDGFTWRYGEIFERAASIVEPQPGPAVPAAVVEEKNPPNARAGGGEPYTSAGLRLSIWVNTLEMIRDRPFIGFGLGNHKIHYPMYHSKKVKEQAFSEAAQLVNVHNDYLQVFAELGVAGMVFLGWFLVLLLGTFRGLVATDPPARWKYPALGMGIGMLGLLVNALFCFPFHRAIPPVVFMAYAALAAGIAGQKTCTMKTIHGRTIPVTLCLLVTPAIIAAASWNWRGINADRHYLNLTRLESISDWQGVIAEGEAARHLAPHRKKILSYLGRSYVETGQFQKGIENLKLVVAAYPYHMNALLNLGVALGGTGDHEKALEAYGRVLAIKDDYGKVHNNIGNIYMEQKKFDLALEEFRISARLDPNNAVVHFNVGIAAMQRELYDDAAAAFARAVRLNPDWPMAQKNLGVVYHQYMNRREEGLRHLEKAIELDPDITDAEQIRSILAVENK